MIERVTCGPMVAGGDSIIKRPNEKVLFVEGGLPGEVVDIEVTRETKDLRKGRVTNVVEASPERIVAHCPAHADGCGGCLWGHMSATAHRANKINIVTDALSRIAKQRDVVVEFGGAVSFDGYRNTVRLGVHDGQAGFRRHGSRDVIAGTVCSTVSPRLRDAIMGSRLGANSEVLLRLSETDGSVIVLASDPTDVDVPGAIVVDQSESRDVWTEELLGDRRYKISPQAFFQSGLQAASLLANTVSSKIPKDVQWIVDAYAGVGVIGGVVAHQRQARLTAVEQNPVACRDARHNLSGLDAHVIEAEVAMVELTDAQAPEVVIADPSRTGLGPSAAQALSNLHAPMLVLISCDPASLARDTTLLARESYQLSEVTVLDLYPQTPHVETVSCFYRP